MIARRTADDPPAWAQSMVLLLALAMVWHSLDNHGLYPPDEARYAAVSGWMAEHGNWLEPRLGDQLHITKPPLTYWAQALSQRMLGHKELAVRMPSALASSLLLIVTFRFARRAFGAMPAMLAVGVLSAMPLFEVVGRLAITDPLLAAWWWGALCCAWMAVEDGTSPVRRGWVAGFWACCAMVGLTKGPLVLAPPVIVAAWLALAGRLRDARAFVPWIGLPLSIAPLALVAWGYWSANPARAESVWRFEFVDRFTGGTHDDPRWLVPAAFMMGLFPATAMMTLPVFNVSWARAWGAVRAGDLRALLVAAVVLPLAGFTLLRGSSPTYVLPMAAPLSVLVGLMLARWVGRRAADVPAGERLPDVRITTGIVMTAIGIGVPTAAATVILRGVAPAWAGGWTLFWLSLCVVPAMVAAWIAMAWWGRPSLRLPALGACFVGSACIWLGAWRAEDVAMSAMSPGIAARALAERDGPTMVFGLPNASVDWYLGRWVDAGRLEQDLAAWLAAHEHGTVLTDEWHLERLPAIDPAAAARLRPLSRFDGWPMKRLVLCEVLPPAK